MKTEQQWENLVQGQKTLIQLQSKQIREQGILIEELRELNKDLYEKSLFLRNATPSARIDHATGIIYTAMMDVFNVPGIKEKKSLDVIGNLHTGITNVINGIGKEFFIKSYKTTTRK